MPKKSLDNINLTSSHENLDNVLSIVNDSIIIFDNEGTIKYINPAAIELFQYTPDEIIGKKIGKLIPDKHIKEKKNKVSSNYNKTFREILGTSGFTKGLKKNGETISIKLNSNDIIFKGNLCFVAAVKDYSKQSKKENTAELISQVQNMYINKIPLPEIFGAILNFMIRITGSKYGFIGPTYKDTKGSFLKSYAISNINSDKQSKHFFEKSIEHGLILRNLDVLFGHILENEDFSLNNIQSSSNDDKTQKKELHFGSYLALPIKNSNNLTIGMFYLSDKDTDYNQTDVDDLSSLLCVIASILESSRNVSMVEDMANIDPLSKAYNRNYLNKYLADKINNIYINNATSDFAVIMIDCNDFKKINDFYGHDYGDHVLIELVKRIKRLIKETDIVARLGGDEFIIVANNIKSIRDIESIAERINNICNQNYIFKGKAFHSGVSIGIAPYSSGMKINTLLKQADLALYKSKSSKTNYSFFSEDLEKIFISEQELEKYILKAFSKDLFFFHYQPQIDLTTNNISGFEALLRFDLPDNIDATTQDLVNHVRKIGLSEKLNLYAVKKVIEEVESAGLKDKRISINISPYVKDFLKHIVEVVKIIDESDLPNNMFELELIEDAFGRIMSLKKNNHISDLLKEKCISLTIDDFGVEYSSINRLIDHNVDALKIDQTFIRTLHKDDRKQIIVKAIIGIAKSLGIKSVAEGVEYQIHEDILKELGCDYVQGYLYSKPLALKEAMQLISKPITKHIKELQNLKEHD